MPLKIYGNHISRVKTGITVPKDANVEIGANSISDAITAIEVRDDQSLRSLLGLSRNASAEDLAALLRVLEACPNPQAASEAAKASDAERLLAAGSSLTTLVSGFWQLKESGLVKAALATLGVQA